MGSTRQASPNLANDSKTLPSTELFEPAASTSAHELLASSVCIRTFVTYTERVVL